MAEIFDGAGNSLGNIELGGKQRALLDAGESVTVLYHTPQLMHDVLGVKAGSFEVRKEDARLITSNPTAAKDCARMQAAIKATRGKK